MGWTAIVARGQPDRCPSNGSGAIPVSCYSAVIKTGAAGST